MLRHAVWGVSRAFGGTLRTYNLGAILPAGLEQIIYWGCAVPDAEYTILLRRAAAQGGAVFVVVDRRGDAFIFSARGLRCRLGDRMGYTALLPTLLNLGWQRVPIVAPYSLAGLHGLLAPLAA